MNQKVKETSGWCRTWSWPKKPHRESYSSSKPLPAWSMQGSLPRCVQGLCSCSSLLAHPSEAAVHRAIHAQTQAWARQSKHPALLSSWNTDSSWYLLRRAKQSSCAVKNEWWAESKEHRGKHIKSPPYLRTGLSCSTNNQPFEIPVSMA